MIDALDRDIGPQTLKDEIVYVLRHAAGPMLRIPLMERCKLAGTFDNFSIEFGELVANGTVRAVGGHGPRMLFTLSESAQQAHRVERDISRKGNPEVMSFNRTATARLKRDQVEQKRQLILQHMSSGGWMHPAGIRKGTGLAIGACNYLLTQLMHERKLQRQGRSVAVTYRITDAGIAAINPETLVKPSTPEALKAAEAVAATEDVVVRVKLAAREVRPFFKFLSDLRSGAGASA